MKWPGYFTKYATGFNLKGMNIFMELSIAINGYVMEYEGGEFAGMVKLLVKLLHNKNIELRWWVMDDWGGGDRYKFEYLNIQTISVKFLNIRIYSLLKS